jgi:DNA-binding PadR family transcriptional regulator
MSLPHLILGLLSIQPFSGYDLNKTFQETVQHFWTTEQSQIYRALHRMGESGWVTVETVIQSDSPNKKIYHLTEAGGDELRRWLRTPLLPDSVHEAWLGQIFFGGQISLDEVAAVLRANAAGLEKQLRALEALLAGIESRIQGRVMPTAVQLQLATLDYGIQRHRFELGWLQTLLEKVAQMQSQNEERDA